MKGKTPDRLHKLPARRWVTAGWTPQRGLVFLGIRKEMGHDRVDLDFVANGILGAS